MENNSRRNIGLFFSKIISQKKGEEWTFDLNLSSSQILTIIWEKIVMRIRGLIRFRNLRTSCYVGYRSKIRFKKLITYKQNLIIGNNCYINALSLEGIKLGRNVSVGNNTNIECTGSFKEIGKGLIVGDNVGLGAHSHYGCAGGIVVKNDTIVGNYVSFHSENHNYSDLNVPIRLQGVNHMGIAIGSNCWIGAKVTILDGVSLGNGCIVAAGSVLTEGVYEDNSIYGGVPAKLLKSRF